MTVVVRETRETTIRCEVVRTGAGEHQRVASRLGRAHRTLDQFQRGRPVQTHAALSGIHRLRNAEPEVPDVFAKPNGLVPIDRRCEPRVDIGARIGNHMRRRKCDPVQRTLKFGGKRPRGSQAIGLHAAIGVGQLQRQ